MRAVVHSVSRSKLVDRLKRVPQSDSLHANAANDVSSGGLIAPYEIQIGSFAYASGLCQWLYTPNNCLISRGLKSMVR